MSHTRGENVVTLVPRVDDRIVSNYDRCNYLTAHSPCCESLKKTTEMTDSLILSTTMACNNKSMAGGSAHDACSMWASYIKHGFHDLDIPAVHTACLRYHHEHVRPPPDDTVNPLHPHGDTVYKRLEDEWNGW